MFRNTIRIVLICVIFFFFDVNVLICNFILNVFMPTFVFVFFFHTLYIFQSYKSRAVLIKKKEKIRRCSARKRILITMKMNAGPTQKQTSVCIPSVRFVTKLCKLFTLPMISAIEYGTEFRQKFYFNQKNKIIIVQYHGRTFYGS